MTPFCITPKKANVLTPGSSPSTMSIKKEYNLAPSTVQAPVSTSRVRLLAVVVVAKPGSPHFWTINVCSWGGGSSAKCEVNNIV